MTPADDDATPSPARIIEQFQRPLQAFLVGLTRDVELARDLTQETFARWLAAGGEVAIDRLRAWLFQVAHNLAMEHFRREQVDRRARSRRSLPEFLSEAAPGDELLAEETALELQRAIRELPADQRRIVELRLQTGHTFAEIAASEQLPLGTVLTRMRLAVERLRMVLRDSSRHSSGS